MANLIIVQHWVVLWYATIHGGGYHGQNCRFELVVDNTNYFGCDLQDMCEKPRFLFL